MASLELLDRFRTAGRGEHIEVVEHEPPRELVAAEDIVRFDGLGRKVVACPAGQAPHSRLQLTSKERDALVKAFEPPPDGTLEPGHCGFTPRNTAIGYGIDHVD